MQVFILGTGRCGTKAFVKACSHMSNFSSGHESAAARRGELRFAYPDNHIEADNRLSWHLGSLTKHSKPTDLFVHLKRNREAVAKSFMNRFYIRGGIMDSFSEGIRLAPSESLNKEERFQMCLDYIDTVNANIELFLKTVPNSLVIQIEEVESDFTRFWKQVGAEGDLAAALEEFAKRHNNRKGRNLQIFRRSKLIFLKEWKHFWCWWRSL